MEIYDRAFPGSIVTPIKLKNGESIELACFIEHRFALYYWLKWHEKYDRSISLLSIDYHTDTMPERSEHQFSKDKEPILSIWQDMDEGNDTQICAGLSNELFEHAYILHKGDDRTMNNCESISYYNHPDKLFSADRIHGEENLYLDIDLDYFTNGKSDEHSCKILLHEMEQLFTTDRKEFLFPKIRGITVALEPIYCGGLFNSLLLLLKLQKTLLDGQIIGDWPYC